MFVFFNVLNCRIPDLKIITCPGAMGFDEAVEAHDNWTTLAQQSGEFTQAKGQEVMESILKQSGDDIDVVYCENDNEAFGAIDAIEAAGYEVG